MDALLRIIKQAIPVEVKRVVWGIRNMVRHKEECRIYHSVMPWNNSVPAGYCSGKRCFIIGGGPSINQMDLSPLNNEYCVAVNRGFLLQEKGLHQVEFYGLSDYNAYREYGHKISPDFAKHFCIFGAIPWDNQAIKNPSFFSMYSEHSKEKFMSNGFFQFDLSQPVAHTYTIALQMLQVAVHAGFSDVYFIGVDNDFSGANMHFYTDSEHEKKNMKDWNFNPCPDNERAFSQAFQILTRRGVNLYNAGVGGKLSALPRVDFRSLFPL